MDQLRKWFVVVMLSVVWAVERQLEGNSGVETVVAPLLVAHGWARSSFPIDGCFGQRSAIDPHLGPLDGPPISEAAE
jgi:hypothetical protein